MCDFKVPAYFQEEYPWLTKRRFRKYAWYPVPDEQAGGKLSDGTPCKGVNNYGPGDIIIFNEFNEWKDKNGYNNDRFQVVEQEEIDLCHEGVDSLLPSGVVLSRPPFLIRMFYRIYQSMNLLP